MATKYEDSNHSSWGVDTWQNSSQGFDNTTSILKAHPQVPSMMFRFVLQTGLCMPISILGLLGNILAWIVLFKQRPRLTTTVLLMGLAVADSLVLIMTVLVRSIRYLCLFFPDSAYGASYLKYYHYIFVILYPSVYFIRMVDTWLTVLLTIDRFIAVYRPLHAQGICTLSKAYRNMIILIITSLVFSLPRFFEYTFTDANRYKFKPTPLNANTFYMVIYQIVLFLVIMYLVPMALLVILNAKLLTTLRHAESYRQSLPSRSNHRPSRSNNKSVTTIVVVVVAMCIVSNVVALIAHFIFALEKGPQHMKHLSTLRRYMSNISNLFITISCATNFLIYCLCSRNFRMVLVRTFRYHNCIAPGVETGTSSMGSSIRTNNSGITNFSLLLRVSTRKKQVLETSDNHTTKILKEEQQMMI